VSSPLARHTKTRQDGVHSNYRQTVQPHADSWRFPPSNSVTK